MPGGGTSCLGDGLNVRSVVDWRAWRRGRRITGRRPSRRATKNEYNFMNCSNLHLCARSPDDVEAFLCGPEVGLRDPCLRGDANVSDSGFQPSPKRPSIVLLRASRCSPQALWGFLHQSGVTAMVLQGGPDLQVELLDSPAGNGMPWRQGLKASRWEWPRLGRHGFFRRQRHDPLRVGTSMTNSGRLALAPQ